MRKRTLHSVILALLASVWMCVAQEGGAPIRQDKIDALRTALTTQKDETSAARQRLAVKRMIRDGNELLETNPTAPNRFEILGLVFSAQQRLFRMDDSARNREALLETCKELAKAPDQYAALRLDADLLLTQTELGPAWGRMRTPAWRHSSPWSDATGTPQRTRKCSASLWSWRSSSGMPN